MRTANSKTGKDTTITNEELEQKKSGKRPQQEKKTTEGPKGRSPSWIKIKISQPRPARSRCPTGNKSSEKKAQVNLHRRRK